MSRATGAVVLAAAVALLGSFALTAGVQAPPQSVVEEGLASLADGSQTPVVLLRNEHLEVAFLPELGGKIISLKAGGDREVLSRTGKPYTRREFGMGYGDTEFDGLDECFPTLSPCRYPAPPWEQTQVVDHGEVCQVPWERVGGNGVVMEARGVRFPYGFRRQATLEGNTLVLDYTVTNDADSPFHFTYTFHPLFLGETGLRLEVPDDVAVTALTSTDDFLGREGQETNWGEVTDEEGRPFKDNMFTENSNRWYKFVTAKLPEGATTLRYADGTAVSISWPVDLMPYLAVWCTEGAVSGMHHIGVEPSVSQKESLDEAYEAGQTAVVPAKGEVNWQIRLMVVAGP